MARLIRIGSHVINLDRVQFTRPGRYDDETISLDLIFAFFEASEVFLNFSGPQMTALTAYLEDEATDVMAWHAERKRREAEDAAQKTRFHANLALLEQCTDEAGHAWKLAPADGFDCVRCGAHDRSKWLPQTIDCWGGVKADTGVGS